MSSDGEQVAPRPRRSELAATERLEGISPPSGDDPAQARFAGRYVVLERLGSGGFGSVLLVEDVLLPGHRQALKIIRELQPDAELESRFLREIRVLMGLPHPRIPPIHNYGRAPSGELYFAMAFVEGRTLEHVLREEGRLAPPRIFSLLLQMLEVLEFAHRRGVVHRDLKPTNVMLSATDRGGEHVHVLDFGIAKILRPTEGMDAGLTGNVVLGTPDYMSPEQVRGNETTPASDMYALGVLLYRMALGRLPFTGGSAHARMIARLETAPQSFDDAECPTWLASTVRKLLVVDVERRPTAGELRRDLIRLARRQRRAESAVRSVPHPATVPAPSDNAARGPSEPAVLAPTTEPSKVRRDMAPDSTVAAMGRVPAIALIATAVATVVTGLLYLLFSLTTDAPFMSDVPEASRSIFRGILIVWGLVFILAAALILVGGIELLRMRRIGMVKLAAALCIIPCTNGWWIVGIPIGIWTLAVIRRPRVVAEFNRRGAM